MSNGYKTTILELATPDVIKDAFLDSKKERVMDIWRKRDGLIGLICGYSYRNGENRTDYQVYIPLSDFEKNFQRTAHGVFVFNGIGYCKITEDTSDAESKKAKKPALFSFSRVPEQRIVPDELPEREARRQRLKLEFPVTFDIKKNYSPHEEITALYLPASLIAKIGVEE